MKKKNKKSKRPLVHASGEQCFWVTDGKVLGSLVDLRDALASMNDEVFKHHVSKTNNDFSNWIEHVLADAELAVALRKARKPKTARTLVVRHLKLYEF